jgi:hypothetical protein
VEEINQFMMVLNLFVIAVGGTSLIVGTIGVGNIMLVSVAERTREIGIRKAIGAPRRAIMRQFLIESMVLAGMGRLDGVVLGGAITVARCGDHAHAGAGLRRPRGIRAGHRGGAHRELGHQPVEALRYE